MKIRLYAKKDLKQIMDLYYDCVHTINANDYSEEELDALAPLHANAYQWESQLEKNHTLVCVNDQDEVVGFGNIGHTGFLDRLYVSNNYTRQGIATSLVSRMEDYARTKGVVRIDTISTISSLPFFEAMGYKNIEEQVNEIHGIRIIQYMMEKEL